MSPKLFFPLKTIYSKEFSRLSYKVFPRNVSVLIFLQHRIFLIDLVTPHPHTLFQQQHHLQAQVRPPRRKPPDPLQALGPCRDLGAEPQLRRRPGVAPGQRRGHAHQPQRRHLRRPGRQGQGGAEHPVPPGGEPGPARRGRVLRDVCGGDGEGEGGEEGRRRRLKKKKGRRARGKESDLEQGKRERERRSFFLNYKYLCVFVRARENKKRADPARVIIGERRTGDRVL